MLKRLWSLLGLTTHVRTVDTVFDPVYGLPQRAVDEWLARNPQLGKPPEALLPHAPDKTGVS
jgi:hypothetical protein